MRAFASFLPPIKEVDPEDGRRKKLLWVAKQRGWLELDWLVGTFADKYIASLTDDELVLFEEVLETDNPDLFNYLSEQQPTPENLKNNAVFIMMAEYVNSSHRDIMERMSRPDGGNQNL